MEKITSSPTREYGTWLEWVEHCNKRLKPCWNAYCMDETMRATEMNDDTIAEAIMEQVKSRLRKCRGNKDCPINHSMEFIEEFRQKYYKL